MDSEKTENKEIKKPKKKERGFFSKLMRDFFLGCAAFIPMALLVFLFGYLLNILESIGQMIFGITHSLRTTAIISTVIVLILIYIGRKIRRRESSLLSLIEQFVIAKIPIIGGWYETFRDIVQTFTAGPGADGYLGTAKVPVAGGYIIGFISNREELPDGSVQVTVFVPTSPNPTTGLVFFMPEEIVEYVDMTPEEAFTKIISLGVKS